MLMQQVYDEKIESKILLLLFYNFLKHSFLSILQDISKNVIEDRFIQNDFKRLENYANNLVDYHLVLDLIIEIAKLFFNKKLSPNFTLSEVQTVNIFLIIKLKEELILFVKTILLGIGLQNKSIYELEKDLSMPSNQLLALLNKIVKRVIILFEDMKVRELSGCLNDKNLETQSQKIKGMVPIK